MSIFGTETVICRNNDTVKQIYYVFLHC